MVQDYYRDLTRRLREAGFERVPGGQGQPREMAQRCGAPSHRAVQAHADHCQRNPQTSRFAQGLLNRRLPGGVDLSSFPRLPQGRFRPFAVPGRLDGHALSRLRKADRRSGSQDRGAVAAVRHLGRLRQRDRGSAQEGRAAAQEDLRRSGPLDEDPGRAPPPASALRRLCRGSVHRLERTARRPSVRGTTRPSWAVWRGFAVGRWSSWATKRVTTPPPGITHNFGMARPEGYRKAVRLMDMAEQFGLPVLSFIDTAGAYPGLGAEERGQAEAIARSTERCLTLGVPSIATITGEGGSGGAIAIAAASRVIMLEHSIYSVISPEGAAGILWRDGARGQGCGHGDEDHRPRPDAAENRGPADRGTDRRRPHRPRGRHRQGRRRPGRGTSRVSPACRRSRSRPSAPTASTPSAPCNPPSASVNAASIIV